MYIANLSISGIVMTLFCIPPTALQILYGGWWHMGLVACKLVPVIQGQQKTCMRRHCLPLSQDGSILASCPRSETPFLTVCLMEAVVAFLSVLHVPAFA
jgi:hypothetical protein